MTTVEPRPSTDEAGLPAASAGHVSLVTLALAHRTLNRIIRVPVMVIPTVAMPVFFIVAFTGAYGRIVEIPGFPDVAAVDWFLAWSLLQGAAFAGVGTAFTAANDLETGFFDRYLVAPTPRLAFVTGALLAACVRTLLPVVTVLPLGFLLGAQLRGGAAGLVVLLVACFGVAMVAALWGLGVVYRAKTQRAGALIQVGIFTVLFLSIGQVPLTVMTGWLHAAARINPMTNVLRMARQGFIGDVTWAATWPGLLVIVVALLLFGLWVSRGMRTLVP